MKVPTKEELAAAGLAPMTPDDVGLIERLARLGPDPNTVAVEMKARRAYLFDLLGKLGLPQDAITGYVLLVLGIDELKAAIGWDEMREIVRLTIDSKRRIAAHEDKASS